MCGGSPNPPAPSPIVQPVRANSGQDEQAPTIELASEDSLEIAKKKKSKKGTQSMQTDLNIPNSGSNVTV